MLCHGTVGLPPTEPRQRVCGVSVSSIDLSGSFAQLHGTSVVPVPAAAAPVVACDHSSSLQAQRLFLDRVTAKQQRRCFCAAHAHIWDLCHTTPLRVD
jgi:hypothetical protein